MTQAPQPTLSSLTIFLLLLAQDSALSFIDGRSKPTGLILKMSDYKDILKRGWHPEKKGETLKSQVVSKN